MNRLQLATALAFMTVSAGSAFAQGVGSEPPRNTDQTTGKKTGNYVTENSAGQVVVLDRATGMSRPLTAVEAQRLAQGLSQLIDQSSDGLVQIQRADGAVSMDLEGHFQNVTLAKKEADGSITLGCVDSIEGAAAFFEIDENLFDASKSATGLLPSKPLDIR